jgi:hypothetical protein
MVVKVVIPSAELAKMGVTPYGRTEALKLPSVAIVDNTWALTVFPNGRSGALAFMESMGSVVKVADVGGMAVPSVASRPFTENEYNVFIFINTLGVNVIMP